MREQLVAYMVKQAGVPDGALLAGRRLARSVGWAAPTNNSYAASIAAARKPQKPRTPSPATSSGSWLDRLGGLLNSSAAR